MTQGRLYTVPQHKMLSLKSVFGSKVSETKVKIKDLDVLELHSSSGNHITLTVPLVVHAVEVVSVEAPYSQGVSAVALG